MVVEWKPTATRGALGQWEAHTTVSTIGNLHLPCVIFVIFQGIGSKLLAKMGYIVG